MIKKLTISLLIILGIGLISAPQLLAEDFSFIEKIDAKNEKYIGSAKKNMGQFGKLFVGFLPFLIAIGLPILVYVVAKKKTQQGEEDQWKLYAALGLASIVGFYLGWYILETWGDFMFPKHGGADRMIEVFSTFWSEVFTID